VSDVWEPDTDEVADCRHVPAGHTFEGYPHLLATFPGRGIGPNLLLNGHIDVVSGEPFGAWSSHPFHAGVRGGRIYGRGVVDMKGGVAAMVFAAEVLARRGVALGGDLLINTVTEEESTRADTIAAIAHGPRGGRRDRHRANVARYRAASEPAGRHLVGLRCASRDRLTRRAGGAAPPRHHQGPRLAWHLVRHAVLGRLRLTGPRWLAQRHLRAGSGTSGAHRGRVLEIEELIRSSQTLAVMAMRFCGLDGTT
jgi:hypothetical protein